LTEIVGGAGSMGLAYSYHIIPNWPVPLTFWLKEPDSFYYGLRQGNNYFFAFLDTNGSGEWEPGKPAAIAEQNLRAPAGSGKGLSGHYIGWHENDLTFGLSLPRHGYPRIMWANAVDPVTGLQRDTIVQISRTTTPTANLLNTITIRAPRNYLHEGDILMDNSSRGGTGLDWGFGGNSGLANEYTIVAYDATTFVPNSLANVPLASTQITYSYPQRGSPAATPTITEPLNNAVMQRSEMEFKWDMPKQATGFQLVIWQGTAAAPTAGTTVYNSGILPPLSYLRRIYTGDTIGCAFTPEFYANQLIANTTYSWMVYTFTPTQGQSAYNPPTAVQAAGASSRGTFRVTPTLGSHSETFSINLNVSFFTPNIGASTRTVFVEAFRNAGFTGMPAARETFTFAGNEVRPVRRNVTLAGLDSKQSYYVRAYVRTNNGVGGDGDAPRQIYDPWGYVCEPLRGDWRYDPMRIGDIRPVLQPYELKIYATDINGNKIPDIDTRDGGVFSPAEGGLLGGDFSPMEFEALLNMVGDVADTTGSGLPDSLEANLGIGNNSSNGSLSPGLLEDLGLVPADPFRLVISGMDKGSIQWALGTEDTPGPFEPMGLGGKPGFSPLSSSKAFKSQVLYVVERTDKLGAETNWKPVKAFFTTAPLGSVELPVDATKSSGFYRIKLIELPKKK